MRLISQDGTIDVPYEQVSIEIKENGIWCGYYATLSQHCISKKFAEYSTEAKAIKAMEMLRERHTHKIFWREDIQYKAEIMLDEGLDIVREMMMKCEYFRFPKDDEVKE